MTFRWEKKWADWRAKKREHGEPPGECHHFFKELLALERKAAGSTIIAFVLVEAEETNHFHSFCRGTRATVCHSRVPK
jgi:hypothetical protein